MSGDSSLRLTCFFTEVTRVVSLIPGKRNPSFFKKNFCRKLLNAASFISLDFHTAGANYATFHLISPLCPHFTSAPAGWLHVQRANFTSLFEPHYVFPPFVSSSSHPADSPSTSRSPVGLGTADCFHMTRSESWTLCQHLTFALFVASAGKFKLILLSSSHDKSSSSEQMFIFGAFFMVLCIVGRIDCKLRRIFLLNHAYYVRQKMVVVIQWQWFEQLDWAKSVGFFFIFLKKIIFPHFSLLYYHQ